MGRISNTISYSIESRGKSSGLPNPANWARFRSAFSVPRISQGNSMVDKNFWSLSKCTIRN